VSAHGERLSRADLAKDVCAYPQYRPRQLEKEQPIGRILAICILAMTVCLHYPAATAGGATATGPDGSNAQAVHALGITGAGVNVGVISVLNTRVTHEAFYDKGVGGLPTGSSHAFWHDATNDGYGYVPYDHDTWIAGIVASRGGAAYPADIGVAPGVDIYSERISAVIGNGISNLYLQNALDNLVSKNCRVVFSGFQFTNAQANPDGNSIWTVMYDYYADTHNIVFANPAGNENPRVTVFGDAYNGITTGGLDWVESMVWRKVGSISNLGLTSDGRRKPDLAAPSYGQTMPSNINDTDWYTWPNTGGHTSLSTPHTAGVAALLLQYADSTTDTADNQNEVIRAVIVNSAFPNIRDNNGVSTTGQLYNVARGYGRIDAMRAYQTLAAAKVAPGSGFRTSAMKGWAYNSVNHSSNTYYVAGAKNQRLLVTLTWNRKVTVDTNGNYSPQPLVNLGLRVTDPNGVHIFEEAVAKDNLRRCDILLSKTGDYRIRVNNSSSTSTDYGLAFEIIPPIAGDFNMDYIVDYKDMSTLTSQWLMDGPGLAADMAAPTGHIDFADFAAFAQNWRTANNAYWTDY
jgi:hypothetical protein